MPWAVENMIMGMNDYPDKIKKLLSRLTDIYIEWTKAQFDLIPPFEGGYCNQYGLWAPGTSIRFQEDLAINLSPELFKEFLLSCHQKIVESFDYQVLHTHSGFSKLAEWALENKHLKVIEVVIDRNGPKIEDLIALWKKIQTQKPLILVGLVSKKELCLILSKLFPRGLFLDIDIVAEDKLNIADFYSRQTKPEIVEMS